MQTVLVVGTGRKGVPGIAWVEARGAIPHAPVQGPAFVRGIIQAKMAIVGCMGDTLGKVTHLVK